jgi:amidase
MKKFLSYCQLIGKLLIPASLFLSFHGIAEQTLSAGEYERIQKLSMSSTIPELQTAMNDGRLTSVSLTQFYLQQIEEKNQELNAVISVLPNALANARMLDKERKSGKTRGHLHGIPIIIKDNIETKKVATTAGSLALKDNLTNRDATLIKNLKRAGAIILAKANLSEWANFRSERSSSGWSAMGGQTKNPHDLNRSPCGSSAGSAVAVAANLAVAAVGTETDGSISCPSSATGVVGIKPTLGLVSRYRIIPIAESQDTAGPIAKSVTDASILLAAMQGKDNADLATKRQQFNFEDDYQSPEIKYPLKGLRIGLLKPRVHKHEGVDKVYDEAILKLKEAGAIIVTGLENKRYADFGKDHYNVLLHEFKHYINHYLNSVPTSAHGMTLESLIQFNLENSELEMPYFEQEIFVKAQEKGNLESEEYLESFARLKQATREDGLDQLFKKNNVDIVITPSLGPAWSIDLINGGQYTGGYSSYSAISGYPYLTFPMGKVKHLPIGLSVLGLDMEDAKIIDVAKQMESLFKVDVTIK